MRIEISALAEQDIGHLHSASLQRFGPEQTNVYVLGLLDLIDLIGVNPMIGRLRPELGQSVRLHRYQSHVIFYRIDDEVVRIIRILHGKQDWAEHL